MSERPERGIEASRGWLDIHDIVNFAMHDMHGAHARLSVATGLVGPSSSLYITYTGIGVDANGQGA
jgi:hypothetical protein